jgi:hypothetical protein
MIPSGVVVRGRRGSSSKKSIRKRETEVQDVSLEHMKGDDGRGEGASSGLVQGFHAGETAAEAAFWARRHQKHALLGAGRCSAVLGGGTRGREGQTKCTNQRGGAPNLKPKLGPRRINTRGHRRPGKEQGACRLTVEDGEVMGKSRRERKMHPLLIHVHSLAVRMAKHGKAWQSMAKHGKAESASFTAAFTSTKTTGPSQNKSQGWCRGGKSLWWLCLFRSGMFQPGRWASLSRSISATTYYGIHRHQPTDQ